MQLVIDLLELLDNVIEELLVLVEGFALVENWLCLLVGHQELLHLRALRDLLTAQESIHLCFDELHLMGLLNLKY